MVRHHGEYCHSEVLPWQTVPQVLFADPCAGVNYNNISTSTRTCHNNTGWAMAIFKSDFARIGIRGRSARMRTIMKSIVAMLLLITIPCWAQAPPLIAWL